MFLKVCDTGIFILESCLNVEELKMCVRRTKADPIEYQYDSLPNENAPFGDA